MCGCQGKGVGGGLQGFTFMQSFQLQHSKSRVTSKTGRNISQVQLNMAGFDAWLGVALTLSGSFFSGWLVVSLAVPPCG